MDPSRLYDQQFFDMHQPWRPEYIAIADTLNNLLAFSSAVDFGCGNGFILARLVELDRAVCGVDGSAHARDAAPDEVKESIIVRDLTAPVYVGEFDLAICTEVAEHLDCEFAETLVDTVCAGSRQFVYFTAATPGQGGNHHVNEQPHSYWIEKLRRRGFELNDQLTTSFRQELSASISNVWWFVRNSMIFQKDRG